jgi:hypothetical protein
LTLRTQSPRAVRLRQQSFLTGIAFKTVITNN